MFLFIDKIIMQKYELVLLLNASLQEKERQSTISALEDSIKDSIVQKDEIWLKTTVYEFDRKKWNDKFYFYSYLIEANSQTLDLIKQQLLYNKVIARYYIFKMSDNQEFFKFDEVNSKLNKILETIDEKKIWNKVNFFSKKENKLYINWKCVSMLKKYLTRFGNIKPRKYTDNTVSTQKAVKEVISRARELWMLEYIK